MESSYEERAHFGEIKSGHEVICGYSWEEKGYYLYKKIKVELFYSLYQFNFVTNPKFTSVA